MEKVESQIQYHKRHRSVAELQKHTDDLFIPDTLLLTNIALECHELCAIQLLARALANPSPFSTPLNTPDTREQ